MQGVINRQTGDVFLVENENDIHYEHLLGSLKGVGFYSSMLYLFQGNIKNYGEYNWMPPASILLKAILDDKGLRSLPDELQLLRIESVFDNEFMSGDKRRTMIVSPLFVGADLYGLLVNELDIQAPCQLCADFVSACSELAVDGDDVLVVEIHSVGL